MAGGQWPDTHLRTIGADVQDMAEQELVFGKLLQRLVLERVRQIRQVHAAQLPARHAHKEARIRLHLITRIERKDASPERSDEFLPSFPLKLSPSLFLSPCSLMLSNLGDHAQDGLSRHERVWLAASQIQAFLLHVPGKDIASECLPDLEVGGKILSHGWVHCCLAGDRHKHNMRRKERERRKKKEGRKKEGEKGGKKKEKENKKLETVEQMEKLFCLLFFQGAPTPSFFFSSIIFIFLSCLEAWEAAVQAGRDCHPHVLLLHFLHKRRDLVAIMHGRQVQHRGL